MKRKRFISLIIFFIVLTGIAFSQDPLRFKNEVDTIIKKYRSREGSKDLILFTGSSSIRRWQNIPGYFPQKNIINTAFGGSQMSDLIYFSDLVIFRYKPIQIFIYEGDNDLAAGKKPDVVIKETDSLLTLIHKRLPLTEIVIISAKPSPVRWKLKENYIKLNEEFRNLSVKYSYVTYLDLWSPLISVSGRPNGSFFASDSLHLNSTGYDKWAPLVGKVLK